MPIRARPLLSHSISTDDVLAVRFGHTLRMQKTILRPLVSRDGGDVEVSRCALVGRTTMVIELSDRTHGEMDTSPTVLIQWIICLNDK